VAFDGRRYAAAVRLLHLADRLSDRGGAHWHLRGVLSALASQHELKLAVGMDEGALGAPCSTVVVPGLESRTRQPVALDELVAAFDPDVLHVHNLMNPAVLEWAADRGHAVLTVQDHRYFCPTRGKWTRDGRACRDAMALGTCAPCFEDDGYFREVYALTEDRLRAARRLPLLVLSSYMKEELVVAGVPAERIHVIPPFVHGLDLEAEADGPPCVLFVGRLVEAKGVRDVVEAWRRAEVGLPLVLVGTGPLREALAGPGLEVRGWVDRASLSRLYRRARAVVLASRWQEPFGIVGLEALAFGVPVVAWDSGGVREWHHGPVAPWGDVDGLARTLRQALGQDVQGPAGFEREPLMRRLVVLYEQIREPGPPLVRNHT